MAQVPSDARRMGRAVTGTAIGRLARRAGARQISSLVPAEAFGITTRFLENVVSAAKLLVDHANRKTVGAEDVKQALEIRGYKKMYSTGAEKTMTRCKPYQGSTRGTREERAARRIRFEQKQAECYTIPRAAFQRTLRGVSDRIGQLRWTTDAAALLHVAVENHLVDMLDKAVMLAAHAGRATVMPRDLQLVRVILG